MMQDEREETTMNKKKKKETDFLKDVILRNQLQNYLYQQEQMAPYGNAIQQAETDGLLQERKRLMQSNSDMLQLAMELQKSQREHRKTRRTVDDMGQYIGALTKRCNKMEKKIQGLSEQVHFLCQKESRQKEKLKKCRLQMHRQKKILRCMGAYIGVSNPTDNLGKIANKYSKKIESNYMGSVPRIIDADYREVKK